MTLSKDRWLAANLSFTVAGLGQFYAARPVSGAIFLALEMAIWGMFAGWVLIREVPTSLALATVWALPLVKIVSLVHARRAILKLAPAPPNAPRPDKNPWLSVFLSRIIPGSGHLYARRWGRGVLFLGFFVGGWFYNPPEKGGNVPRIIIEVILTLILIDAFFVLRDKNVVGPRLTAASIALFVVAFQTFAWTRVLQACVVESYRIPSSAMEPTLMGDASGRDFGSHPLSTCPFRSRHVPLSGDRILVSKLAYLGRPVERFDVVVFRFPLNQSKTFVKRVVGLPGEEFMIHHGNIFVKREGEAEFRIARRDIRTQDSIWIPVDEAADYLSSKERFERSWKCVPVVRDQKAGDYSVRQEGLSTTGPEGSHGVRFEHQGRIGDGHDQEVGEIEFGCDFELTKVPGFFFVEVTNEFGTFALSLATDEGSDLRMKRQGKEDRLPLEKVRLTLGQRRHLAFSIYDGQALVRLDGQEVGRFVFFDRLREETLSESGDRGVAFGARDLTFKATGITLGRDLYYKGRTDRELQLVEDKPIRVPAQSLVMFGDNVDNSHDSRSWRRRAFILSDGRTVVAEAQDVENSRTISEEEVMERYKLSKRPTVIVSADMYGNPWALYADSAIPEGFKPGPFVGVLKTSEDEVGFHFVEEKYVEGRVQKVWWPLERARPVR